MKRAAWVVLAALAAGCGRAEAPASTAPPPAITVAPALTALASVIASAAPPAAPAAPKRACGATRVVVAGDTLAGLATACYGARAYDDLLARKNALQGSTVVLGQSLTTPPLRDLVRCAPAEVCEPVYAAHAAFLEAQALTEHARIAPPAALPHLDDATRALSAALGAAEARGVARPKSQLKSALGEIASLRAGSCGEPGYCEHTFHQHLVYALQALEKGP